MITTKLQFIKSPDKHIKGTSVKEIRVLGILIYRYIVIVPDGEYTLFE